MSLAIASTESRGLSPWATSLSIHLGVVVAFAALAWPRGQSKEKIDFEVFEQPRAAARPLQLTKPVEKPKAEEKRAVFGVSRKALTDATDTSAPSLKTGNTVAKDPDKDTLRDDDPDAIPIPVDEYLVSSMPVPLEEYRIPYPAEARKAKVEGPVVMDVLIDSQGRVRDATLIGGPGFGLNEAALAAVERFKFKPAQVQDRPVAVRMRFSFRFKLEN